MGLTQFQSFLTKNDSTSASFPPKVVNRGRPRDISSIKPQNPWFIINTEADHPGKVCFLKEHNASIINTGQTMPPRVLQLKIGHFSYSLICKLRKHNVAFLFYSCCEHLFKVCLFMNVQIQWKWEWFTLKSTIIHIGYLSVYISVSQSFRLWQYLAKYWFYTLHKTWKTRLCKKTTVSLKYTKIHT